jgi:hypothetical protein
MTSKKLAQLNDAIKAGAEFYYYAAFRKEVRRNPLEAVQRKGQVYLVFIKRNGDRMERKIDSCVVATDNEAGRLVADLLQV